MIWPGETLAARGLHFSSRETTVGPHQESHIESSTEALVVGFLTRAANVGSRRNR
jgi:hypothetical protein